MKDYYGIIVPCFEHYSRFVHIGTPILFVIQLIPCSQFIFNYFTIVLINYSNFVIFLHATVVKQGAKRCKHFFKFLPYATDAGVSPASLKNLGPTPLSISYLSVVQLCDVFM